MLTIRKYPLTINDVIEVEIPRTHKVLSVQVQYGVPCLWALVDPTDTNVTRHFWLYGTEHPIHTTHPDKLNHLGTFQLENGQLVFHLFERNDNA